MEQKILFLLKSSVHGYARKDGVAVRAHIRRAAKFAAAKHKGQTRKDGKTPYIKHPVSVATILHNEGGITDHETLVAALLHDTIEDTATTAAELEREFGGDVARMVVELTKDDTKPKAAYKQDEIDHSRTRSERANMIKIADKIANLRDLIAAPPPWSNDEKRAYFDHALQVVEAMPNRHPVLQEVFDKVHQDGLAQI